MESDLFLENLDSSELQIANKFLTNWLPFLTKDLCEGCEAAVLDRIQSLNPVNERNPGDSEEEEADCGVRKSDSGFVEEVSDVAGGFDGCFRASHEGWEHIKATGWDSDPEPETPNVRMSWADMVQQEQLEEEKEQEAKRNFLENEKEKEGGKEEMSREERKRTSFTGVGRKHDFVCLERMDGRIVNILEGLELHTGVFSAEEQKRTVDLVYELQEKGRNKELGEHTYSEEYKPRKDMRGKGHTTIQFGCYDSMEHNRNPRGIVHGVVADPMPNLFKVMIKRLIDWHVIPASCEPDCCRVNIYETGDFLPPDISSHGFVRPFCTVSFLNECSINFGYNLIEEDAGEFIGSTAVTLPVGSVLILNGKGADVAKHCVPIAPSKRITITFWKMEKNKLPQGFRLDPDLQSIRSMGSNRETNEIESSAEIRTIGAVRKFNRRSNRARVRKNSIKAGGPVFERLTPGKKSSYPSADANSTINHSGIERARDSRASFPDEADGIHGRHQHGWKNNDGGDFNHNGVSGERSVNLKNDRGVNWKNGRSVSWKNDDGGHFNRDEVSSERSASWKNDRSASWKDDDGVHFNRDGVSSERSASWKDDDDDDGHFNCDGVSGERSACWKNDRSGSWKEDGDEGGHFNRDRVSIERSASWKNDISVSWKDVGDGGHFSRDGLSSGSAKYDRTVCWKDDNGGHFNRNGYSGERSASCKNYRSESWENDRSVCWKNDRGVSWENDDVGGDFNRNGVSSVKSASWKNERSVTWNDDDDGHFNHNEVSSGRSVRVEQKRIIITCNLDREDDSFAGMSNSAHPHFRISASKNNQRKVRVIQ